MRSLHSYFQKTKSISIVKNNFSNVDEGRVSLKGVSDLKRYYRKLEDINPESIMKYLHLVYTKGEIINEATLLTKLVEFGVKRKMKSF